MKIKYSRIFYALTCYLKEYVQVLSFLSEGKAMATAYDCKFIETSVGINHNVDELLVGLLSQIRLKLENPEKSR